MMHKLRCPKNMWFSTELNGENSNYEHFISDQYEL